MEQKAQQELLSLFHDAMKVGGAALEMRVRRFTSFVRSSDEELAAAIGPLIASTRSLRDIAPPAPVDSDTKLALVRYESLVTNRARPTLSRDLHESLDQIVVERRAMDRLMEAGLTPVKSLLMSGPPGVGKTMTAAWLAAELQLPLMTLDLASVMSSFLGRTGANIRAVLQHAQSKPCVLLLDEFDAIAKRRSDDSDVGELKRLVTVILQAIDDWPTQSLLVAATNHGDLLDPAVWRRFDVTLTFELPDLEQRVAVLQALAVPSDLAGMVAASSEGQSLAAISRAVSAARKRELLEGITSGEALLNWVLSLATRETGSPRKQAKARRELEILRFHFQGLSAREIAQQVKASHTTVLRAINKVEGK